MRKGRRTEAKATVTFRGSVGRNCRGGPGSTDVCERDSRREAGGREGLGAGEWCAGVCGLGVLRAARVPVATLLALASL